ncbi:MAG: hypothetical protein BWY87_00363 [Deltaproteobacteria bacterium ADurb.Bin510]|nr:MAG: hypothetical protein BWY87_00363 [Deltaproteobacteria bacterium ADurb.Bin510]
MLPEIHGQLLIARLVEVVEAATGQRTDDQLGLVVAQARHRVADTDDALGPAVERRVGHRDQFAGHHGILLDHGRQIAHAGHRRVDQLLNASDHLGQHRQIDVAGLKAADDLEDGPPDPVQTRSLSDGRRRLCRSLDEHAQHLQNLGIEPGIVLEPIEGGLLAQGLAGAGIRQVAEGLDHGHDAGADRNGMPLESIGIAGAIEGLVVVPNDRQTIAQGAEGRKHLAPKAGMAGQLVLLWPAGRAPQQLARQIEHAEIMQQSTQVDKLDLVGRQAQGLGQMHTLPGD